MNATVRVCAHGVLFAHIVCVLRSKNASSYAQITPHITPPFIQLKNTRLCLFYTRVFCIRATEFRKVVISVLEAFSALKTAQDRTYTCMGGVIYAQKTHPSFRMRSFTRFSLSAESDVTFCGQKYAVCTYPKGTFTSVSCIPLWKEKNGFQWFFLGFSLLHFSFILSDFRFDQ